MSGTPGVGKTTLSPLLCEELAKSELTTEWTSVSDLAEKNGTIGAEDLVDGAREVDVDALADLLSENWLEADGDYLVVDGHLSHLLPVDAVVIVRCHPDILERRLSDRGYSLEKVAENVEWELIGGVWNDIDEESEIPIVEVDSSTETISDLIHEISTWVRDGFKPNRPERSIDWIEEVHGE